jgi:hypothetical protein
LHDKSNMSRLTTTRRCQMSVHVVILCMKHRALDSHNSIAYHSCRRFTDRPSMAIGNKWKSRDNQSHFNWNSIMYYRRRKPVINLHRGMYACHSMKLVHQSCALNRYWGCEGCQSCISIYQMTCPSPLAFDLLISMWYLEKCQAIGKCYTSRPRIIRLVTAYLRVNICLVECEKTKAWIVCDCLDRIMISSKSK